MKKESTFYRIVLFSFLVMVAVAFTLGLFAKTTKREEVQVGEEVTVLPPEQIIANSHLAEEWAMEGIKTTLPELEEVIEDPAETYDIRVTGYTAGPESTGKKPGHPLYGVTASGIQVHRGTVSTVAADPNIFKIGTVLHIPGYGVAVVADTGGAIKGHRIDLYFETVPIVYQELAVLYDMWEGEVATVTVLEEGKGKLSEAQFAQLKEEYKTWQE